MFFETSLLNAQSLRVTLKLPKQPDVVAMAVVTAAAAAVVTWRVLRLRA